MKTVAVIGTRGFPGIQGGVEVHGYHLYTRMSDVNVRLYRRRAYLTPQSSQAFPNIEYIDLPSTRVKDLAECGAHPFSPPRRGSHP